MQDDLKVLFTGDLSITGTFRERLERGQEIFDEKLLALFASHHFTVVNLEGPATSRKIVTRRGLDVLNPPASIPYLVARNITVFNCANNHIFDCGVEGFSDTVQVIEAAGGRYFGAGVNAAQASRPLRLEHGQQSVALIGICNHPVRVATENDFGTFHDSSIAQVAQAVHEAEAVANYTVLNYHAGEEYTTVPMPSRRRKMLRYAELGPRAIIGHHSHVVQGHEQAADCDVFYSLGNFVFDIPYLRTRQFTEIGALVSLTFSNDGMAFEFIPTVSDLDQGQIILGGAEQREHFRRISDFSNYSSLWRRDAYRTLHQVGPRRPAASATSEPRAPRKRFWSKLLSPHWYRQQYLRLANPNQRPIVLAACQESFRRWFRR